MTPPAKLRPSKYHNDWGNSMNLQLLARRLAVVSCATLWLSACGGGGDTNGGVPTVPPPTPNTPSNDPPPPAPTNPERTSVPTEIGTPIGQPVSKLIGVAGGELSSADASITVTVPAGAFAEDKTVSIQEITNHAHGAKGRAFRIAPEGLDTPVPMTVRFRYDQDTLRGTTLDALSIAYQDAKGVWYSSARPLVNTNAMTVSVATTHFSDWSLSVGVQILPNAARVKVGESLPLRVMVCEREVVDENDELIVPMFGEMLGCEASPLNSFSTKQWSVNSVEGGGGIYGTVIADADHWSGKATYTAPATKPAQNVVAVSAQHDLIDGPQTLVANITIDDAFTSCEAFKTMEQFEAELAFDQFTFAATAENRRHDGKHAGRLVGTLKKVVSTEGFGYWTTVQTPLLGGAVSISDSYSYEPPSGDGYSGTIQGSGAPHDEIRLPSFVAMKLNYAECTFDLFGTFIVDGTMVENGEVSNGAIGIGGLYLFGNTILPEQVSTATLEGSRSVNAKYDIETTGYVPLTETHTDWSVSGNTTARWKITPQ
jgi:hypothetical protein